jgi:uncharacterized membrane protein
MNEYQLVKWLHVLSAAILFGTGIGIAFFTWAGYLWCRRTKELRALSRILDLTVVADWVFTAPAVLFQFISGVYLLHAMGMPLLTVWSLLVMSLYLLAGVCWIPVVMIQYGLRNEARAAASWDSLGPRFARMFAWWFWLGVPAFAVVIALYAIMIAKPWFGAVLR